MLMNVNPVPVTTPVDENDPNHTPIQIIRYKREPNMIRNIRCITLDVMGTVINISESVSKTYSEGAKWAGLDVRFDKDKLEVEFTRAFRRHMKIYPGFKDGAKEWWRRTVRETFQNGGVVFENEEDFEVTYRRIYQHYATINAYFVYSDVIPFIKWCNSKGIVLGIISNCSSRVPDETLPQTGLSQHFRFFTVAGEVGVNKPDPLIFQSALSSANHWVPDCKPEHILHIGDNHKTDFVGATNSGFNALCLDRSDEFIPKKLHINSLMDAIPLIDV
eukprot:TRINITY_DN37512_c0_g1_i1.p1 TRINITY_DN37512_c0_g1~~TRINITY_DN37512_c0_g1_i1.p1  ORF type:complete len:275 (+),score=29.44 TRINITY_DN37512_c0_g1_i1:94-918(+)